MKNKVKFFDKITGGNSRGIIKSSVAACLNGVVQIIGVVLVYLALNATIGALVKGEEINFTTLWIICGLFIPTVVLYLFAETWEYNSNYMGAYKMAAKGRTELADNLKKLPLGYIKSRDPGDLSNAIMNDYAMLETLNSHVFPQMVGAVFAPCLVFLMLLFTNWKMSLAMICAIPVAFLVVGLTMKFQDKESKRQANSRIRAANRLQEYLSGIKHIKSNNMSGEKFERLKVSQKDLMKDSIRLEALLGPIIGAASIIMRASTIVMTLVGSYMLLGGEIDIMTFIGFLLLSTSIYVPITTAFSNFSVMRYALTSGERILELKNAAVMNGSDNAPQDSNIQFENVTFKYKDKNVLENISLSIPAGKVTALVGPSGSGKSTVTRIAARFWDVNSGRVTMGGKDIRECDPDKYLYKFSEVFQDTYLFQDTIAGNIAFGKQDASKDEIIEVAKAAECHDFIMKMPNGYDTMVGEGGTTLSGGEKQRIAIARALLKNAPIIILDEATASLDAVNELAVQSAINRLVMGRTVIVIAHKLKTVRNADNIIVLDNGKIVEQGTHDVLLKKKGLYAKLVAIQNESQDFTIV